MRKRILRIFVDDDCIGLLESLSFEDFSDEYEYEGESYPNSSSELGKALPIKCVWKDLD